MPISETNIERALRDYLRAVVTTEAAQKMHLCGGGAVGALEKKLKVHYGMKYALCISNATTGLLAIAMALELRGADFVTTPYTYGATISGWLLGGSRPIFADIDSSTLTLDCDSIRRSLTPKIKAILVSDIYGIPHDTFGLRKVANEYGLWYISDSAQSLGASRDNLPAGALADALVISFTVGKTVFAGEGAAIVTDNASLYQKLVWFTQHPMRQKRELGLALSNEFGLNARIHPLAGVWANASLESSLRKLGDHQKECFYIIEKLNATGLTQPINFQKERINPAFFRLTAEWKRKPRFALLTKNLQENNLSLSAVPLPIRLLYRQPAFLAQYGELLKTEPCCPISEQQARDRFCLVSAGGKRLASRH